MTRLVIVSHTAHYKKGDEFVGWGPTVREISYLSQLFDSVVHVAPLYAEAPALNALPYDNDRVELVPVPPAGGAAIREKLTILRCLPLYVRIILRELKDADVVHVRCPANISLIAVVLLAFIRKPRLRWIKYAGNWNPEGREALSYTLQRWWLKRGFAHAQVTVNGEWHAQPAHVHTFLNPCLTDEELDAASKAANQKEITSPIRLIFVGRLEDAKGVQRALDVAARLKQKGTAYHFDLIGDGPFRPGYEQTATALGLGDSVTFHGWLSRTSITPLYDAAHFLLFPSSSEGWPKVISEAMAAGVVPITSNVSSIPQYLRHFGCGRAIAPDNIDEYTDAILGYLDDPGQWQRESKNASAAAERFSYSNYLRSVQALMAAS